MNISEIKKLLCCDANEAAIIKIIELCSLDDKSDEEITEIIERGELTCNKARNGREVLWYLNGNIERCIYADTLDELSEDEIEKELL